MKLIKTPMGHIIYRLEDYEIKAAILNYLQKAEDLYLDWDSAEMILNSFGHWYSILYKEAKNEKN